VCLANRLRRSSGAGHDQGPGLRDRLGPLDAGRWLDDPSARRSPSTAPVPALRRAAGRPDCAARAALDRVQRVGLALTAAVLAVGAAGLDDADARRR